MGRTLNTEHEKLLRSLADKTAYSAAEIKEIGLNSGTWSDRSNPERAALTFQKNLGKKTPLMGKPDDMVNLNGGAWLPAWTGAKWKEVFGVE